MDDTKRDGAKLATPFQREPLRVPLVQEGAPGINNSSSAQPPVHESSTVERSVSSTSTATTEYFGEATLKKWRSGMPSWLGGGPHGERANYESDNASNAQLSTSTISPSAKRAALDDLVTGNRDEWAALNQKWTFIDQRRLNSVDGLFHRSLEYHNLNHSFRVIDRDALEEMANDAVGPAASRLSNNAVEFHFFHGSASTDGSSPIELRSLLDDSPLPTRMTLSLERVKIFLAQDLSSYGAGSRGLVWLHVRDLRALHAVAEYLGMDYICHAGFFDLRAHSNVHCTHNAVFMTLCTMHLSGVDAHLYKVYAFASKAFLVTFERDLLPDIAINQAIVSDLLYKKLEARISGISSRCSRLGSMHGLYEIAMEALGLSDEMVEFMSRSISFVKKQMGRAHSLPMLTIINAHRTIQILRSCTLMLDRQVMESANFFCRFKDSLDSLHSQLNRSIATKANYPYITDMADSYRYRSLCLRSLYKEELIAVLETLKSLQNLSSMKKNIDMTLVATVFLPLTFIASVYGMNFEVNGGYSIGLLNDKRGPEVFWAMCVFVLLVNLFIFLRSGFISWTSTYKWLVEDEETERKEAIVEELRRVKESRIRRSIASYGSRIMPLFTAAGEGLDDMVARLRTFSDGGPKALNVSTSHKSRDTTDA